MMNKLGQTEPSQESSTKFLIHFYMVIFRALVEGGWYKKLGNFFHHQMAIAKDIRVFVVD